MRKSGKKIKHRLALKPLGVKSDKYELDARAALLAMKHNVFQQQHLVDLYILADICEKLSDERYIKVHSESVKRLIESAYDSDRIGRMEYAAMEPSADVLLAFFGKQKNSDIARVCLESANCNVTGAEPVGGASGGRRS